MISTSPSQRPIECPTNDGSTFAGCCARSKWTVRTCRTPRKSTVIVTSRSPISISRKVCSTMDIGPPLHWQLATACATAPGSACAARAAAVSGHVGTVVASRMKSPDWGAHEPARLCAGARFVCGAAPGFIACTEPSSSATLMPIIFRTGSRRCGEPVMTTCVPGERCSRRRPVVWTVAIPAISTSFINGCSSSPVVSMTR